MRGINSAAKSSPVSRGSDLLPWPLDLSLPVSAAPGKRDLLLLVHPHAMQDFRQTTDPLTADCRQSQSVPFSRAMKRLIPRSVLIACVVFALHVLAFTTLVDEVDCVGAGNERSWRSFMGKDIKGGGRRKSRKNRGYETLEETGIAETALVPYTLAYTVANGGDTKAISKVCHESLQALTWKGGFITCRINGQSCFPDRIKGFSAEAKFLFEMGDESSLTLGSFAPRKSDLKNSFNGFLSLQIRPNAGSQIEVSCDKEEPTMILSDVTIKCTQAFLKFYSVVQAPLTN